MQGNIKRALAIGGAMCAALALAACGGKGSAIELSEREIDIIGTFAVKGPLPDWPHSGNSLTLAEEWEGMTDVMKMTLRLGPFGGTGIDEARMKEELSRKKARDMELGAPELVKDIAELRPGVWSYAVKRDGFSGPEGTLEYSIVVLHLPGEEGESALFCEAEARFDMAKHWQQLESICAGLTLVEN